MGDQHKHRIVMPQFAESVVTATIGKWLKQPGDTIAAYEPICEVITDKVTAELPSTVDGYMAEILVAEGVTVEVGTPICVVSDSAEFSNTSETSAISTSEQLSHSTSGISFAGETGSESMRSRISPAVRRLADDHGIDLQRVTGTGVGGRITRKDMLAYIEMGNSATVGNRTGAVTAAPAYAPQPEVQAAHMPVRSSGLHLQQSAPLIEVEQDPRFRDRGESFIDVTQIRSTIASKMRQAVTEIPHAWTMIEVDVTNIVLLRNKLKDEFFKREGVNLTYLAFVLKAVVNAIKDYPIMNSVWGVDKIIVKRDINISLAVGTEDAVFVPVIKQADQKTIAGLAVEIDLLTRKAREGKLQPQDNQGGTFTVNNTGSFGSILSYPIINYPQAANFTFESIVKRPVVINDMLAVRSMVNLCLSLDHRILDGVICGRFLQRVKDNLESFGPETRLY